MGKCTRRDFLKASAGTAAALGASQVLGGVPRLSAQAPSTVHVALGDELSELYRMACDAAQAVGIGSGPVNMSGTRVFIKMNMVCMGQGTFVPHYGDTTKAEVALGVAEQCLRAGADKVTIGDASHAVTWDWSTVGYFSGNTVFDTTNMLDAVAQLQLDFPNQEIELTCLHEVNEWEFIPSTSTEELMAPGIKLGKAVADADHLITISPLKTHQWADISCSMKNLVGTICAFPPYGNFPGPTFLQRDNVHRAYANITSGGIPQAGIEALFTDIIKWRKDQGKQDFAFNECSVGVEGNGPRPFPAGFGKIIDIKARSNIGRYYILAGNDIPAVDATAIRIMGQDVETIRQLVIARALRLGEITNIDLMGASINDLLIPDFLAAKQVDEWGLASTVPPALHGTHTQPRSKMVNTIAGLALPAVLIGGLHAWHQRKQSCCQHRSPVKTSDEEE